MFKKILLDNPPVLAMFIQCGMGKKEVEMIEAMITPDKVWQIKPLSAIHISTKRLYLKQIRM